MDHDPLISEAMSRLSKRRKKIVGGFKDPAVRKKAAETRRKKREQANKEVEDLKF